MLPLDKGELSSGGLGGTATHGPLLCLHSPYSRSPETWQRRKWAWKVKKRRGRGLAPTSGKRRRSVSVCWSPRCRRMWPLRLLTPRYTSTIHYKCLNICLTSHRWQLPTYNEYTLQMSFIKFMQRAKPPVLNPAQWKQWLNLLWACRHREIVDYSYTTFPQHAQVINTPQIPPSHPGDLCSHTKMGGLERDY